MITIIEHPLVMKDITILRDKKTNIVDFRNAIKRLSYHLAIEAARNIEICETQVETPLETTDGYKLNSDIVIMPILRAGLGLLDGFLDVLPEAKIAYIGLKRDEATFQAQEYYYSLPKVDGNTLVIILEIMLATGGSVANTISRLQLDGINNIIVASIISAPEGIENLITEYPNLKIITTQLDRTLDENKYILPGLGDAGDRINGTI